MTARAWSISCFEVADDDDNIAKAGAQVRSATAFNFIAPSVSGVTPVIASTVKDITATLKAAVPACADNTMPAYLKANPTRSSATKKLILS